MSKRNAQPCQKSSPPILEPKMITISCGAAEAVVSRPVSALAGGGLALHRDFNQPAAGYSITHLASGRKVCEAGDERQARLILFSLLKLEVNWSLERPWRTEAEARLLATRIDQIAGASFSLEPLKQ